MGVWEWKGMMRGGGGTRGGGLYGFVEGEEGIGRMRPVKAEKEIVRDKAVLGRKEWNKGIVVGAAVLRKKGEEDVHGVEGQGGGWSMIDGWKGGF